jgi:hypothetical protein
LRNEFNANQPCSSQVKASRRAGKSARHKRLIFRLSPALSGNFTIWF